MKRDKVLSCLTRTAIITTVIRVIALLLMTGLATAVLISVVQFTLPKSHEMAILKTQISQAQSNIEALKAELTVYCTKLNNSCPGYDSNQPASSCQQILDCNSSSSSGYYWIASEDGNAISSSSSGYYWIAPEDGNAIQRYCSMTRVCGGRDGGWMRVAELDMTNSGSQCPSGLRERVHPGQRLCEPAVGGGRTSAYCSSTFFEIQNVRYEQVCGKIIAYQFGSTESFGMNVGTGPTEDIDSMYVDGVSLTYSSNPRKHIWTFAAALDEMGTNSNSNCPCTNITTATGATPPPDFVGNDYFCDTGSNSSFMNNFLYVYADDPLWDGAGCGPANFCCSLNNPPWFFKQLESSTSEDIEMRVCSNQSNGDENILIEQIEIYVR